MQAILSGDPSPESTIVTAHGNTCAWILEDSGPDDLETTTHNFMAWLRSDHPHFWVSGKAASGKSTLMKFIYHDSEVESALQTWAGHKHLVKLGHFFFDRGSGIQKSREGMLRSLLFQILETKHGLLPLIFPHWFQTAIGPRMEIGVMERDLRSWVPLSNAFTTALSLLQDSNVCLFIDGLDEYRMIEKLKDYTQDQLDLLFDGRNEDETWGISQWITDGHREVAELLLDLGKRPNIKICFASRELTIFERLFRDCPRVQIHHHTAGAIKEYCENRLEREAPDLQRATEFAASVTAKASGVFLWVSLVIDMLISGNDMGDDEGELWQALEGLPERLGGPNGLYMLMMKAVDKKHLHEAARLFQLVIQLREYWSREYFDIITLFLAAEGHLQHDKQQNALLRVREDECQCRTWDELRPEWTVREKRLKNRCGGLLEGPANVQFMHQTAKEFIIQDRYWQRIFGEHKGFSSKTQTQLALISGYIRRLKRCKEARIDITTAMSVIESEKISRPPSYSQYSKLASNLLVQCLYMFTLNKSPADAPKYIDLMDELDAVGSTFLTAQAAGAGIPIQDLLGLTWVQWIFPEVAVAYHDPVLGPAGDILELAIAWRIHQYTVQKLNTSKQLSQSRLARLLVMSCTTTRVDIRSKGYTIYGDSGLEENYPIVQALFAAGADPNFPLEHDSVTQPPYVKTAWTLLLAYLSWSESSSLEAKKAVELFLQHGADLSGAATNALVSGRNGQELVIDYSKQFRTTKEDVKKIILKHIRKPLHSDEQEFPHLTALLLSDTDHVESEGES